VVDVFIARPFNSRSILNIERRAGKPGNAKKTKKSKIKSNQSRVVVHVVVVVVVVVPRTHSVDEYYPNPSTPPSCASNPARRRRRESLYRHARVRWRRASG
jgi:hypothetical protein